MYLELPLTDRLPDQPDGVLPRELPLPGFSAFRLAAVAGLRGGDSVGDPAQVVISRP